MGDVLGVSAWVRWLVCQRGWHGGPTKVSNVGDVGGNTIEVRETVLWVMYYFSNSFQKLAGNEHCLKLEQESRFQIIYTFSISHFLEFPMDI